MKIRIPLIKQKNNSSCGPLNVQMILTYLGEKINLEKIENLVEKEEGKGINSIKLAYVAAKLGYKTEFFSKSVKFNEENMKLEFYKKNADIVNKEEHERWMKKAKEAGVRIFEKTLTLKEIKNKVNKNNLAFLLIDWAIARKKPEFSFIGHYVVISGFSNNFVYIHNSGPRNPKKFIPMLNSTFDKARRAQGTDEDIIFISRK